MSPEQATGNSAEVGPATDIYALELILYEMLCGQPPFCGEDRQAVLRSVRFDVPVAPSRINPKVPHELDKICLKCLQKKATDRYASAAALAEDLQRFLDQPNRWVPTLRTSGRSHRLLAAHRRAGCPGGLAGFLLEPATR